LHELVVLKKLWSFFDEVSTSNLISELILLAHHRVIRNWTRLVEDKNYEDELVNEVFL
jgi:hypothetical protein